jgi:ElaB/YqjD/DUF883 family membrane-anchored ribosome-binding protein
MATTDKSGGDKDIAELRAQMDQLQKDVAAIASSLAGIGAKRFDRAKGEVEKRYRDAKAEGEHAAEDVRERVMHYESDLENAIREKPLAAMAGALGVGFIAAMLMKR